MPNPGELPAFTPNSPGRTSGDSRGARSIPWGLYGPSRGAPLGAGNFPAKPDRFGPVGSCRTARRFGFPPIRPGGRWKFAPLRTGRAGGTAGTSSVAKYARPIGRRRSNPRTGGSFSDSRISLGFRFSGPAYIRAIIPNRPHRPAKALVLRRARRIFTYGACAIVLPAPQYATSESPRIKESVDNAATRLHLHLRRPICRNTITYLRHVLRRPILHLPSPTSYTP